MDHNLKDHPIPACKVSEQMIVIYSLTAGVRCILPNECELDMLSAAWHSMSAFELPMTLLNEWRRRTTLRWPYEGLP